MRRAAGVGLFLIASVISQGLTTGAGASHSDPKPNTTNSWYMSNVNHTTHFDAGCAFGNRIESGSDPHNSLTILAYGDPLEITSGTFGTDLFSAPANATSTQIRTAAQQFALGIDSCMPETLEDSLNLVMVLGVTNNFPGPWGTGKSRDHGEKWAAMVKNANDYLFDSGRISFMLFAGGYDVELGWSNPGQARAWANGYESATSSYRLYTFGGAAGCRSFSDPYPGSLGQCGTPTFPEWHDEDVWYISVWGNTYALPQTYLTSAIQAEQWVMISVYGYDNWGGPSATLDFAGPLTTSTGNTPAQAWTDMVNKMDARPHAIDDMTWSTKIVFF